MVLLKGWANSREGWLEDTTWDKNDGTKFW